MKKIITIMTFLCVCSFFMFSSCLSQPYYAINGAYLDISGSKWVSNDPDIWFINNGPSASNLLTGELNYKNHIIKIYIGTVNPSNFYINLNQSSTDDSFLDSSLGSDLLLQGWITTCTNDNLIIRIDYSFLPDLYPKTITFIRDYSYESSLSPVSSLPSS